MRLLSDVVNRASVIVVLVVGHVEGRQVARCSGVAMRGGKSATERNSLRTGHPFCAPVHASRTPLDGCVDRGCDPDKSSRISSSWSGLRSLPWFNPPSRLVLMQERHGDGCPHVCVLLLQDLLQSCSRGGGGEWRTCAMRDDEPRPLWMSLPITH